MHLCLSCNQPCDISSVFCAACRLSLLERSAEGQQEGLAGEVEGPVELAVSSPEGSNSVPLRMTEERRVRLWGSGSQQTVGTLEEKTEVEAEADANATVPAEAQATNILTTTNPSLRRRMPARMRRVLVIFCVIGSLALIVDSVLLTLSIMRHRAAPPMVSSTASTSTHGDLTPGSSTTSGVTQTAFTLSTTHLSFLATQGQSDPQPQTVTLFSDHVQPFSWAIAPVTTLPTWLHLSSAQGHASGGGGAQVGVSALATQLSPGTYTTNLLVKAFDRQNHALAGSPQMLNVLLTVQIPCVLNVAPVKLSFAAVLLSPPSAQTLDITERGSCTRPITWQAGADVPWITFSSSSGVDNGAGSTITVQASSSGKLIGSYTAHITLQATDARGAPLSGAPFTVTVTLTVIA